MWSEYVGGGGWLRVAALQQLQGGVVGGRQVGQVKVSRIVQVARH